VTERRAAAHPAWEVQVDEVYSNTPAAQAGFQTRDVLVRIGTNRIERASDVVNTMFYQRAGDRLRLTVVRVGVTQELALVIGQRPAEPEPVPVVPRPPVLPASINK
jgi:S1-C subfamily serine protease